MLNKTFGVFDMSDLFFGNFVFGMDAIVPYEEYKGPTDLLGEVMTLADAFVEKDGASIHIEKALKENQEHFGLYVRRLFARKHPRGCAIFMKHLPSRNGMSILLDFKEGWSFGEYTNVQKPSEYLKFANLDDAENVDTLKVMRDWLYDRSINHG